MQTTSGSSKKRRTSNNDTTEICQVADSTLHYDMGKGGLPGGVAGWGRAAVAYDAYRKCRLPSVSGCCSSHFAYAWTRMQLQLQRSALSPLVECLSRRALERPRLTAFKVCKLIFEASDIELWFSRTKRGRVSSTLTAAELLNWHELDTHILFNPTGYNLRRSKGFYSRIVV